MDQKVAELQARLSRAREMGGTDGLTRHREFIGIDAEKNGILRAYEQLVSRIADARVTGRW
jgi:hypothetical protein